MLGAPGGAATAEDGKETAMALVDCPECGGRVSDKAIMCPHCGLPMSGRLFSYEYRSRARFFGLPLVHVVWGYGINPLTGRLRVAKGIIAVGNVAIGVVAVGGVALGGVAVGGVALGLAALGGCAIGVLLALGGMAIGLVAIGGGAVGYYALGGGAWGAHALGGNVQDPEAVAFFKRYLGSWVGDLQPPGR
jgi:ribosomal protein L37E